MPRIDPTEPVHRNRRDLHNLRWMLPFLREFCGRALLALACLILAKLANVGVPILLKEIVGAFENLQTGMLVLPVFLLATYGALKFSASLFNELRDLVFARVRYRAMRRLSTRVLAHLHRLSLRYQPGASQWCHQPRSGAGHPVGEHYSHIIMVFSVLPMLVEFALVVTLLLTWYAAVFTLVTFGAVAVYMDFTLAITGWRMDFRHRMNRLDSQANG